ncbi:acetoacetate decarboxylase family protein [Amycolatopsis sp. H20-H5]|uniref:acetoacetate decarboxylase family protein n=1 Tax=Amycolatopsis sp. H20-H5 TaxID=3046309 RepID=UPI002DB93AE6|nr:acetoacetate decarboxylase family protein [Amycolatopsis sp. H20-H5]MEC3976134.1 acetoacetate decarboxylase family protein [Amycolatopsis sp. H20-H5]
MTAYPPEPWHLAGQAYVSLWRLPVADLPKLPDGAEPVVLGGRAQVIAAWIDYQEPGQLSYHELLSTVAVRGKRPSASITDIWVDSEVSLAGGRALWGIPKNLASLGFTHGRTFTATAATDDWIATAAFTRRPGLPIATPAAFDVVQALGGQLKRSPVAAKAKPHPAIADWSINALGPLGYLAGRRPVVSVSLRDFTLRFGG